MHCVMCMPWSISVKLGYLQTGWITLSLMCIMQASIIITTAHESVCLCIYPTELYRPLMMPAGQYGQSFFKLLYYISMHDCVYYNNYVYYVNRKK